MLSSHDESSRHPLTFRPNNTTDGTSSVLHVRYIVLRIWRIVVQQPRHIKFINFVLIGASARLELLDQHRISTFNQERTP